MKKLFLKPIFAKPIFLKRLKAISLIEVSIGLVVIGLLVFGALKGWKWVESTKINGTITQVIQIQSSLQAYTQANHKKPNSTEFWKELKPFGGLEPNDNNTAVSSLGAEFKTQGSHIILAPLNAMQAFQIKNNLDHNPNLSIGWIKVQDTSSANKEKIDLEDKEYKYQIAIEI